MPVLFGTTIGSLAVSVLATEIIERYQLLPIILNTGIAWGIPLPPVLIWTLIPAVLMFLCILAWKSRNKKRESIAFGLIIGGALSNIIDRFPDGVVSDYFDLGWWPAFNVGDSCISVGVILLLYFEFLNTKIRK